MINESMYALGNRRSVIREIFEYCKGRAAEIGAENVFDFSIGNPSAPPPAEVSDAAIRLLREESAVRLHGYTSAQGDIGVRRAIASHIRTRFGVDMTPDLLYMTCGAAASLTISLKALMLPEDECVVFAPFFTEYRVFIENAGGKVVVSKPEATTFQIDVADLTACLTPRTKAVILNSPNNPSGVVYSEKTVCAVCDVLRTKAREFGHPIYLIADEPYRELVFDGIDVPYLMNYYDNTVVCYSYSKALSLPGERIGYIAVPKSVTDHDKLYAAVCGAGRSLGYVCAPAFMQRLVARCAAMTSDLEAYRHNRDLLYPSLVAMGYECVSPDGAFYLFVKAPNGDAPAFSEAAKALNILAVPGDDFGCPGYLRLSYCVDHAMILRSLPAFRQLRESFS